MKRISNLLVVSGFVIALTPAFAMGTQILGSDVYTTKVGTIDRDTAAWDEIGVANAPISGMAYDSNHDVLYGISPTFDAVYTINQDTGAATVIGSGGSLGYDNANGLAYNPITDTLWATDNNTNTLFTVDTRTGVGTAVATISGGFSEIEGLGFDAATGTLYGVTQLQRSVVSIDTTTGEATAVADELPNLVWRGLTFDPEYRVLFLSAVTIFGDAEIYTLDPTGGRLDLRGATTGVEAIQGLAAVPEPASILLCLGMMLTLRRRR